ncbi:MAG: hypothetical protein COB54_04000 [Alphaproteobacteria bacterium]|nr:MAG: hypothetical protein COB54_04000 [Alphaproteobacteria bacterium]
MNYLKLFGVAAFAIGAILYLSSGEKHKVVRGAQSSDLSDYIKISVNASVDLKVQVGEDYTLNVEADEEDLDHLKIYVKGRTLVIENKDDYFASWRGDDPEITISLPLLKKFTLNGSADADILGIHGKFFKVVVNGSGAVNFEGSSDELMARISGSGDLYSRSYDCRESDVEINGSGSVALTGTCEILEIDINGSGDFAGEDFICEKVEVDVVGSGDLEVHARQSLDVDVEGSGDVVVFGNPKKVRDRSRNKKHVTIK